MSEWCNIGKSILCLHKYLSGIMLTNLTRSHFATTIGRPAVRQYGFLLSAMKHLLPFFFWQSGKVRKGSTLCFNYAFHFASNLVMKLHQTQLRPSASAFNNFTSSWPLLRSLGGLWFKYNTRPHTTRCHVIVSRINKTMLTQFTAHWPSNRASIHLFKAAIFLDMWILDLQWCNDPWLNTLC